MRTPTPLIVLLYLILSALVHSMALGQTENPQAKTGSSRSFVDSLSIAGLAMFPDELFEVKFVEFNDGRLRTREVKGKIEPKGDSLVVRELTSKGISPPDRGISIPLRYLESIKLAQGETPQQVSTSMIMLFGILVGIPLILSGI